MKEDNEFEAAYSETSFWDKLQHYAKTAGGEVVEKALLLYYAAQEEKAPAWAKGTIAAVGMGSMVCQIVGHEADECGIHC